MKSNLLIISFMNCVVGVVYKKTSPYSSLSRFSPVLSTQSFIILNFIFRSIIHLKLIFVKDIRSGSRFFFFFSFFFFFLQMHIWLFSIICWKDYLYCNVLPLRPCQRSVDHIYVGPSLHCVLLIYLLILSPILHCLNYWSFIISLEVR